MKNYSKWECETHTAVHFSSQSLYLLLLPAVFNIKLFLRILQKHLNIINEEDCVIIIITMINVAPFVWKLVFFFLFQHALLFKKALGCIPLAL